jgi:GR25 family glycosyltransferase involved in LPS biosynthesis
MDKLTNFFPVYLINLKDHKHRLNHAKKEFKKYGITNYTVIEAIDGRNNDLSKIIHGKYPKIKPSEIGCISSHIKALKHWLDTSDSEYAIIMEDDFSFDTVEHWQFDWDYVIKHIPNNAEIVQMIMIQHDPKFNIHKKEPFKKENVMVYSWSTACYLIKRSYAKTLVNLHYVNGKYKLDSYGYSNQAADVILYSLGDAYSIPLFTHILDAKNSINYEHQDFHAKSKNNIDSWWKDSSKDYTKEQMLDYKNGLSVTKKDLNIAFKIFHIEEDNNSMQQRNILTYLAKKQLEKDFQEIKTPTIIMRTLKDVKHFYKKENINIDPKGHEGNGWKTGELGIWASNYKSWDNFLKSKYDSVILMEDDIKLNKDFNKKIQQYIKELPEDWDVFTVYIPDTGNIRYRPNRQTLMVEKENICRVYQSWSCLCYVVSRSGAKRLLAEVEKPVSSPIDHYLFYHKNLNVYAIKMEKGNICEVYPTESTVQLAKKYNMTGYV